MSKITKFEFIESNYNSSYPKYTLYIKDDNYYIEYTNKLVFGNLQDKVVKISKEEYELIINHFVKYYHICDWKKTYELKDYMVMDGTEWYINIYDKTGIIKEITGYNAYPVNYSSFKNYLINKYNDLKIKYS